MYFPLPSGTEDRVVRGVEARMGPTHLPNGRVNPDYTTGRRLTLVARKIVRQAGRTFNRRVHYLIARGDKSVAGLLKDENVASEVELQRVVRQMTGWQRHQWARMGYPGLREVPRRPAAARPFLEAARGT